ncbi:MAG TPA: hypothetical protein VHO06_17130 [Polyangia bacterium]|nr:hypothetical protein [Polyangia bacterium]
MAPHPSLAYARPYETAETVFGVSATPDFLIQRVRSCNWETSYKALAWVAAKVSRYGADSEEVRQLTIDPLARMEGDRSAKALIEHARREVALRRSEMMIAHEQSISFLQHLVLLEGGGGPEPAGDTEISMWLACAGTFLNEWAIPSSPDDLDELIALQTHLLRFNNRFDPARTMVRSSQLFAHQPRQGPLASPSTWERMVTGAFGATYEEFFEGMLGPIFILAQNWGDESRNLPWPMIDVNTFVRETRLPAETFAAMMQLWAADRETLRAQIGKRLRSGLPHAPTALLYRPFVRVAGDTYVAASPWAIQHQVRFAPWARMMEAAKRMSKTGEPDEWFRGFGQQVEDWCRRVATEAQKSKSCKGRILMPESPGGEDEVEDVVLLDGKAAVLFSVKSRVMDAKAAREAVSVEKTMSWYRDYFFEDKGDDYRGGAVRQLDRRIGFIRSGRFEHLGIRKNVTILPVIVTYDSLGETDQLYRWIEVECRSRNLLQGHGIGPLTLGRVDEFEELMALAAGGKSAAALLRRREGSDRHRRLDQIIYEQRPPKGRWRLPFFGEVFARLVKRIVSRLFGPEVADRLPAMRL